MTLELDNRQRAMLAEMGVQVWLPGTAFAPQSAPLPTHAPRAPAVVPAPQVVQVPHVAHTPAVSKAPAGPNVLGALDWPALADAAAGCQACGLCAGRKNTTLQAPAVPVQADWMVVGDPPDEDEDRWGGPFAEQAGALLDNMLKAAGVSRTGAQNGSGAQGAYVTNVVKCRPPQGRNPQGTELAQCAAFLHREIALVQPKMIVAMGRFANQLLLSQHTEPANLPNLPLGKVRGTVYRYQGIPVVVTYHPKALLRNSADKAKAWADLCLAMDTLDKPLP